MNKLIVLNHKMNLLYDDTLKYIEYLKTLEKQNVVVIPSSIYLPLYKDVIPFGIQNIYYKDVGSYTGEISPIQAKSIGASYALIGHSERRTYFEESNKLINNKVKSAIAAELKVILCIGENAEEKEKDLTIDVLTRQIEEGLEGVEDITNVILAYEPVWAIGTGKTVELDDLEMAVTYLKRKIKMLYDQDIKVLYGGSVNEENILELLNSDIDGLLVGKASINKEKLNKMLEYIN